MPKLRSVLFRMEFTCIDMLDIVAKSFPGIKVVCTAVGRWEITSRCHPAFKLQFEISSMVVALAALLCTTIQ